MDKIQELKLLRKKFENQGLFEVSPLVLTSEISLVSLVFLTGLTLTQWNWWLGFMVALPACVTGVWWIHDLGHNSFFQNRKVNRWLAEAFGLLLLGMPQIEYHFTIHRKHHSFTNQLGLDLALNTGFISWHSNQAKDKSQWLLNNQKYLWFFIVIPLTYPILTLQMSVKVLRDAPFLNKILLIARWAILIFLPVSVVLAVFIVPLIAGAILGFFASLNHFHLDISDRRLKGYPDRVFNTTQNISNESWFMSWISGGLNFHIEHHLFPTMPSRNLKYTAKDIRDFAQRHQLPYRTDNIYVCIAALWARLDQFSKKSKVISTKGKSYDN